MGFIDHINLRIPEERVQQAVEFYREILGFDTWKLTDYRNGERTSFFFKIGENSLLNIRPSEKFERPERKNYDHFCLVVDRNIDELKENLEKEDINILREGEPLGSKGRAKAVYVEDPFGYVIELKGLN